MPYNKPEIIAGNMEERESFSCGCPTYEAGFWEGFTGGCATKCRLND